MLATIQLSEDFFLCFRCLNRRLNRRLSSEWTSSSYMNVQCDRSLTPGVMLFSLHICDEMLAYICLHFLLRFVEKGTLLVSYRV